ncbi:VanZ like family protein [Xylanibacter ruminicola]|uniref:VanZ like family protein n=1 Tax=Xylanibacter ruminicola TaxID=839 RepID=A0A1H4DRJ2_XYLRU|nr:VanZ family protein [Xylanibacter ruminicola]SEA75040.1 VanZ like family protein [Xylanibacter ruminicola]
MVELRGYALIAINSIPGWFYWGLLGVVCCVMLSMLWLKGFRNIGRHCALILLAAWGALVIAMTVAFRESGVESRMQLEPFRSYWTFGEHSYFMESFAANLLNVALFVPVGFLIGAGFRHIGWKKVVQWGCLLSIVIEISQYVLRKGYCETDDVIHNTLGCLIGYGVYLIGNLIAIHVMRITRKMLKLVKICGIK